MDTHEVHNVVQVVDTVLKVKGKNIFIKDVRVERGVVFQDPIHQVQQLALGCGHESHFRQVALSQTGKEIPDQGVMFTSDDGRHVEVVANKRRNWPCETRTYVLQYPRDRRSHQTCAGLRTGLHVGFRAGQQSITGWGGAALNHNLRVPRHSSRSSSFQSYLIFPPGFLPAPPVVVPRRFCRCSILCLF
jgi:hypothetical protein